MSDLPGSTTLAVGAGQGLGCGPGVRVPQAERAGETTAMRAIAGVAVAAAWWARSAERCGRRRAPPVGNHFGLGCSVPGPRTAA